MSDGLWESRGHDSMYDFDHPYQRGGHDEFYDPHDYNDRDDDEWDYHGNRYYDNGWPESPPDQEVESARDELEEIDFESIVMKHSSPHAGIDDFMTMSSHERKLRSYEREQRWFENARERHCRSMARHKWKRRLGSKQNRKWHRDRDGDRIDDHIYWACDLLKEDRALRLARMYELRTVESDAVVCGLRDEMPDMIDFYEANR